jgi:DNA (cytosine-5)-methyltransferase 1
MVANHIARSAGNLVQQRIEHLAIGQKMQDLPEELWHESFRYYVKEDPNRKGGPNLRMIRLDPRKPSPTVTGFVFNKFVHPFENRFITVREAARLQGFPDQLAFIGTLTSTQQQVGNAVPIPLAQAIFESILQFAHQHGFHSASLKGLSLFSGAGGMDIGAEQANFAGLGINTKLALDKWADACNTLRGYYGSRVNVVHGDISELEDPFQCWRNFSGVSTRPDIVYGGPPCQSFSQAGKQKGYLDERGQLVSEFLRFVRVLNPPFFVMENVSNLKAVSGGVLYQHIGDQMDCLGYNVTIDVLLAADFGAPQMRRRLIFLGCRKDIGSLPLPSPAYREVATLFDKSYRTVEQAFEGLPAAKYSNTGHRGVQGSRHQCLQQYHQLSGHTIV